jgi:hypothetical protein
LSGTPTFNCYRLTRTDWTEAATHNRYEGTTLWTLAGGDYVLTDGASYVASASADDLVFSMKALLEAFLSDGATSADLIVIGPEVAGVTNVMTADSSAGTVKPVLSVVYVVPTSGLEWTTLEQPLHWTGA